MTQIFLAIALMCQSHPYGYSTSASDTQDRQKACMASMLSCIKKHNATEYKGMLIDIDGKYTRSFEWCVEQEDEEDGE